MTKQGVTGSTVELCGSQHSQMLGRIVVKQPAEYSRWLGSGIEQPSLAQYRFARFRELVCSGCHAVGSSVHPIALTPYEPESEI